MAEPIDIAVFSSANASNNSSGLGSYSICSSNLGSKGSSIESLKPPPPPLNKGLYLWSWGLYRASSLIFKPKVHQSVRLFIVIMARLVI